MKSKQLKLLLSNINIQSFLNESKTTAISCSYLHWSDGKRTWHQSYCPNWQQLRSNLFHNFLLLRWEKLLSDKWIKIKGVHPTPTYLNLVQNNVSIILGNKILNITFVLQYDFGYDIHLGSDFLKQFAKFIQTTYIVYLTTKGARTLKIPTLKYSYKVRAKCGGLKYEQIAFSAPQQKPSFHVNIITIANLINKLKQIYYESSLQFWKSEQPRAKIVVTKEVYTKQKPMFYSPTRYKRIFCVNKRTFRKKRLNKILQRKLFFTGLLW